MIILGMHLGHDSNYCLVRDGKHGGVWHVETERTTRMKHQYGYHDGALIRFLAEHNVTLSDVDVMVVAGTAHAPASDPNPRVTDGRYTSIDRVSPKILMEKAPYAVTETVVIGRRIPLYIVHHHVAHCGVGYYTSPFKQVTCVSWDGAGDACHVMVALGTDGVMSNVQPDPPKGHSMLSLGGVWWMARHLYPFPPSDRWDQPFIDHEGKIMAHAAYGNPRREYMEILRDAMRVYASRPGRERDFLRHIHGKFDSMGTADAKDLSASLQSVTIELMLEFLSKYVPKSESLVLSGGCAYNCVANGAIFDAGWQNVFVPAAPHDGGLALGAALYVWHSVMGRPFAPTPGGMTPFLGSGFWGAPRNVVCSVVDDLVVGKVVAWFDGPAEMGKRALGARSILFDPRRADGRDRLNRLKKREEYRPAAPSVVLSDSHDWCATAVPPSPYMSFSCQLDQRWAQDVVPGAAHIDGSCRPQIVDQVTNPIYHAIVSQFGDRTGVPMILNTSFNVQEPLVDTPEHAIHTFRENPIDVLYLHGRRIVK